MTTFPIAHAGGGIATLLYLVPVFVLVVALVRTKINDRRDGAPADEQETEPTLDDIMVDDNGPPLQRDKRLPGTPQCVIVVASADHLLPSRYADEVMQAIGTRVIGVTAPSWDCARRAPPLASEGLERHTVTQHFYALA